MFRTARVVAVPVLFAAVLADPAYGTPDRFVGTAGISWIERWRVHFGQKADYEHDPDPPDWVMKRFREIRKAAANE